jgi:hypothetical protein
MKSPKEENSADPHNPRFTFNYHARQTRRLTKEKETKQLGEGRARCLVMEGWEWFRSAQHSYAGSLRKAFSCVELEYNQFACIAGLKTGTIDIGGIKRK